MNTEVSFFRLLMFLESTSVTGGCVTVKVTISARACGSSKSFRLIHAFVSIGLTLLSEVLLLPR